MLIIKGNKTIEINLETLRQKLAGFNKVVIDLGTGDGRYVYKNALKDSEDKTGEKVFYIGVEPASKQLEEFSKKAVRKKLNNILFVVGSIEVLPKELEHIADELKIILPWGTLLRAVAQPSKESIEKIYFLLKKNAKLEIIFGYDASIEPTETARLGLLEISQEIIEQNIVPIFNNFGFKNTTIYKLEKIDLQKLESTWGKRISQREEREIFRLEFEKNIQE